MHFQRLRLSGFKSFVDAADFRIEPGLTGVVGPNGCGKSNLLEALRWVMGATSAKAMRAGGMDDVIFAGAGGRASRSHAEVVLTIDNADRTAPAAFNDFPVLEVSRRIDRGMGSTYRINGREVRARDVQLLFADASTGANSPALVRQGQISELIAARPQNRRMILEEAAGVSGLHSRRHEAELRLRAAETNLERLDDVGRELEQQLNRLKREARQAERYKRLAAEIRALQAALLHARWAEARETLARLEGEAREAATLVETRAREAAKAATDAVAADEALPPLREEAAIAQAVLARLAIDRDRLDREVEAAKAEVARLTQGLARLDADRAREGQIVEDAAEALARLEAEHAALAAEIAASPERAPELRAAADAAEAARARADAEVERLAAVVAAETARRRAAAVREQEARARLARAEEVLARTRREREAVGPAVDPQAAAAQAALAKAEGALAEARTALEAAESGRAAALEAEGAARQALRAGEDQLGRLKTEARGLAKLVASPPKSGFPPALDAVTPKAGYGPAVAAALGDDLDAALDPRAASHWAGAEASPPAWPEGAEPLAPLIQAPPQLAARLAFTALVDRADGDRLAKGLRPGARLVSREGDLWRWDGFVARAEAPRPAAVRLEQKTRLADIEAQIDALEPKAEAARAAHAKAQADAQKAEDALRAARRTVPEAERAAATARQAVEAGARAAALREARASALDEQLQRLEAEKAEAEAALAAALAPDAEAASDDLVPQLTEARADAGAAREAAAAARAAYEAEVRERDGRTRRLDRLSTDLAGWRRRREAAAKRTDSLAEERAETAAALAAARDAPEAVEARRTALLDEFAIAEARRDRASEVLAAAESARSAGERAARHAESQAAEAREARAGAEARRQAAEERLAEMVATIQEQTSLTPEALGRAVAENAVAVPPEVGGIEQHLARLERDLAAIGAVNLLAEQEAREHEQRLAGLFGDKADLTEAIGKLRHGIEALNAEGRERLVAAFEVINGHFQALFQTLFGGGQAELKLIESDDPLEAGLEIYACPPGKRLSVMSLMSGGEQALTAAALIFGVFLANPAPICVLDEVDAPLDDANVDRFCNMLDEMRKRTQTRFIAITHNPVTMSRMDRLFGVTMPERGVSQLVSVDLRQAEALAAE